MQQPNRFRRLTRIIAVTGAVVLSAVVLVFFLLREPTHQGRTVVEWLNEYGKTGAQPISPLLGIGLAFRSALQAPPAPDPALVALRQMGPAAIKPLGRAVANIPSRRHEIYLELWRKLPRGLARRLPEPRFDPRIHLKAAAVLEQLGPEARAALPALSRALERDDVPLRCAAVRAATAISRTESIPLITRALRDDALEVRRTAIQSLESIGTDWPGTVSTLSACLADPNETIRTLAIDSLGRLGPAGAAAMDTIASRFKQGLRGEKESALAALIQLDPPGQRISPILLECLEAPEVELRLRAIAALIQTQAHREDAVQALIRTLDEKWFGIRVFEFLCQIGPAAREAVPKLTALILGGEEPERLLAAATLLRVGAENSQALGVIWENLYSSDRNQRLACLQVIQRFELGSPAIERALNEMTGEPDPVIVRGARETLDFLRTGAKGAESETPFRGSFPRRVPPP